MRTIRIAIILAIAVLLLLAGCASSPEAEERRRAIETEIDAILSQPLDPAEFGDLRRCLRETDFRNFHALDEKHILFKGRRDQQWINTLRARCPDLRYGDVLIVKSFSGTRMCDMDRFYVSDWFEWPWYRRWPWNWGGGWGTGMQCTLGMFQPVTEDQVAEIQAVLRSP